jgi:hypothetical protein
MLVSLTVGKVDAGVTVLLTPDKRSIEFPSILLPPNISSGSIVDINVSQNRAKEATADKKFRSLQERIYQSFGAQEPAHPVLRCRNATQTSIVLEWDPIELATADLISLSLYRNGQKAGNIPRPLAMHSTKISGLAVDTEYTFHLVLRTTAGTYASERVAVRTHKMTDLSGITITTGILPAAVRERLNQAVERIGAKVVDGVRIDTTHFVTMEGRGQAWEKAVETNIPVVRPEWVEACEKNGRILGVTKFYLDAMRPATGDELPPPPVPRDDPPAQEQAKPEPEPEREPEPKVSQSEVPAEDKESEDKASDDDDDKDSDDDEDEEDDGVQPWTLRAFLRNYYIPFITRPGTKFMVVVICLSLFIGGIIGIRSSSIGLELSDVLPENTAPAAFLKARDKYFSFYPMNIVIKGEHVDFARQQHPIEALRQEIGRSRFVVKLENGEPSERYWLGMFRDWLKGLQEKLDDAERRGILTDFDTNNHTKPPDLKIAYSLVCSYGKNYDCSRVGRVRLIDESGTINAEGFYNYLYGWHEYEQMFYTVSQASFYPKYHKLRQGPPSNKYRFFIPPAPKPMYSQIPFYLTGLKDTPVIVEMIKEIRAISEKYAAQGLDNYPQSIAFTFWEQYLDLNWNLLKAIGVISFAVFCVISLLLFNPWAACCIMVVLLMMTVELAGFLGMCSIKFNPVSAVTLITAVGIGVEFTAHVVFAFLTALGTRDERMASCIDQVFVPVIHGALSTLLGIIMLGFSEFEFVVKYFFVVMSALIIIGLINGLALLPVLLSLVGPACEIRPRDGGNRLPVPPPLPRTKKIKEADSNHSARFLHKGCRTLSSGVTSSLKASTGSRLLGDTSDFPF